MLSTESIFWDVQTTFVRPPSAACRPLGRLLIGERCSRPSRMSDTAPVCGRAQRTVIDLDHILGTVKAKRCFFDRLRPTSCPARQRWQRVATAVRSGAALPPVEVIRCPDGCYVIDGCHRVSVARALELGSIDTRQAVA